MQDESPGRRRHLGKSVSPPPLKRRRRLDTPSEQPSESSSSPKTSSAISAPLPTPAAVEAGQATIHNHLDYFLALFRQFSKPMISSLSVPRLSLEGLASLYERSASNPLGHNFIVHQHDHPRAGLHYDLRLQINPTSSCSWSIPYGLPGNVLERRHGRRQAIETRIHCLWNHLIEAASTETGSMLIWDTGEYEVLPFEQERSGRLTDVEESQEDSEDDTFRASVRRGSDLMSECEKLDKAFREGRIRLRLKGARLPEGYTITLRLSRNESPAARKPVPDSRMLKTRTLAKIQQTHIAANDITEVVGFDEDNPNDDPESTADIRAENAYIGALNTINSVHQRWWFLAMDKANCGFIKGKTKDGKVSWTPGNEDVRKKYPFFVKGRDFETSVVTGRKAADVLSDEGVVSFVPRAGWKAALT